MQEHATAIPAGIKCVEHAGSKKSEYTALFTDCEGKPLEVHKAFEVKATFDPSQHFDKEGHDCTSCPLFMHCTTQRNAQKLDPFRIMPCGFCAATQKRIPTSDSGYILCVFIEGKDYNPLALRLSKEAYDAVALGDLVKRFDKCVGYADMGPQIKAILCSTKGVQNQVLYFMFAILEFIQGVITQNLKESSNGNH